MYDVTWLTTAELAFLRELGARGVRYLLVGMSGAILQGVPGTCVDGTSPTSIGG